MIITGWFIVVILFSFLKSTYIANVLKDAKDEMYHALYRKNLNDYWAHTSEYYLNLFTKNIDIFTENYLSPKCDIVSNVISAVVSIGFIFLINWKLGAAFVGVTVLTIMLSQLPGVIMARKTVSFSKQNESYLQAVTNQLHGFEQIKLLNVSDLFLTDYLEKDQNFEKSRKSFLFVSWFANNLGIFFSFFAQLLCMSIGVWFVMQGEITIGLLISAINLLNGVFNPVQMFAHNKNLMGTVGELREGFNQLLDTKTAKGCEISEPIHEISISHLDLKHSEDKIIFEDFNYCFEQGKKYAIIGESGRGKSTLMKLVMKYYPNTAYSGHIRINGIDLDRIKSESLYQRVALIQKNDFLISGSVMDNVRMHRQNLIDTTILEQLNLSSKLLEKSIEASSRNVISSGEKQRVDIARFMISPYDVLIFDEPTSNLDSATQSMIFDMIFKLQNKMVIVITHTRDPKILSQFDEVLNLDEIRQKEHVI